ncbi:Hypothetical protein CAP_8026 [Chondromyces apiculatus DSM 436]|uniref:Uncharacterized protein n=1 Tax=Chondromyces apiculatus DSM 436 TaxID=1192034 RepID=A0A017SZ79_9BACT|nr:Hypothetical protein CAP_8026 [Chondromyces apiculatus DSM 436]
MHVRQPCARFHGSSLGYEDPFFGEEREEDGEREEVAA